MDGMPLIASHHKRLTSQSALKLILYCALLYSIINCLPPQDVKEPLNLFTAAITGKILNLFGILASVNGTGISHHDFSIRIITECTPVYITILFTSFVLAYASTAKQWVHGILANLPILFVMNLLRIVLMIFIIGLHSATMFQYAHVYIGQIFMGFLVIVAAPAWIRSSIEAKSRDTPMMFLARLIAYSAIPFALWLYLDEPFVYANFILAKKTLAAYGYRINIPEKKGLVEHIRSKHGEAALLSTEIQDVPAQKGLTYTVSH